MVWRVSNMEEQRKLFIEECNRGDKTFVDICNDFGISRPTGYKWVERHAQMGEEGLKDLSRAPHTQLAKTEKRIEDKILNVKHKYSTWGPRKIRAYLERHEPDEEWPSPTTVGNILDRHGLVLPRKKRRRVPIKSEPLSHCQGPNDVWCADFKGWFQTKDLIKCDPFTVTDGDSRFILYCTKLHSGKWPDVWKSLESLFLKYGIPKFLRHDNGPPFATCGAGRLSTLSVNLIKAGVTPEWTSPGKPYQNGRHERMHLTLKAEGVFPLQLTLKEQQMKFKQFIEYFNYERPHEALNYRVPADIYVPSERQWDGKLRSPEYGEEYLVKRVRTGGQVSWNGREIFIGKTLAQEYIGIKEDEDGEWLVYYGPVLLGIVDHTERLNILREKSRPERKHKERCY
jgi:putative transposase